MNELDFDKYVPSRLYLEANATGAAAQDAKEIQRAPLIVTSYRIAAFLSTAASGDVIGTPLSYISNPKQGENTRASAWTITASLEVSDVSVFNALTPLPLWGGMGDQDEILTEPWVLPTKRNITFKVVNSSGLQVKVGLLLKGYKALRGG